MARHPDRAYDSFVVRLWHEPASGRLLRAEVEHIQSGALAVEHGAAPEWVLRCLESCLTERAARESQPVPRSPDRVRRQPGGE